MLSYDQDVPDYGDLFTVEEFKEDCKSGCLTDYDGFGYPARNGRTTNEPRIYPSDRDKIPSCATHIVWFNW